MTHYRSIYALRVCDENKPNAFTNMRACGMCVCAIEMQNLCLNEIRARTCGQQQFIDIGERFSDEMPHMAIFVFAA